MHVEIKITLNGGNDMLHEETYCICKKKKKKKEKKKIGE